MTMLLAHKRFALASARLLFSAVLLASVSTARADPITYTICNYPVSQADIGIIGGTFLPTGLGSWSVDGTITTDGTLGSLSPSNITDVSFTISGPGGTASYSGPERAPMRNGGLTATATNILLPFGADAFAIGGYYTYPIIGYGNWTAPYYQGAIQAESGNSSNLNMFGWYDYYNPADYSPYIGTGPGSITNTGPDWIIATAAPEPSTLVLLGIAALGLLGYARRRAGRT